MAGEDELEVVVLVDALEFELKLKPLPLEVPSKLEPPCFVTGKMCL